MTKLLQVVFSLALNQRLDGTGVTSNSLEPGIVATNLSKGITDNPAMRQPLEQGVSVEEGDRTSLNRNGWQSRPERPNKPTRRGSGRL